MTTQNYISHLDSVEKQKHQHFWRSTCSSTSTSTCTHTHVYQSPIARDSNNIFVELENHKRKHTFAPTRIALHTHIQTRTCRQPKDNYLRLPSCGLAGLLLKPSRPSHSQKLPSDVCVFVCICVRASDTILSARLGRPRPAQDVGTSDQTDPTAIYTPASGSKVTQASKRNAAITHHMLS